MFNSKAILVVGATKNIVVKIKARTIYVNFKVIPVDDYQAVDDYQVVLGVSSR